VHTLYNLLNWYFSDYSSVLCVFTYPIRPMPLPALWLRSLSPSQLRAGKFSLHTTRSKTLLKRKSDRFTVPYDNPPFG
jgi:hypothetical protein